MPDRTAKLVPTVMPDTDAPTTQMRASLSHQRFAERLGIDYQSQDLARELDDHTASGQPLVGVFPQLVRATWGAPIPPAIPVFVSVGHLATHTFPSANEWPSHPKETTPLRCAEGLRVVWLVGVASRGTPSEVYLPATRPTIASLTPTGRVGLAQLRQ